MAEKLSLIDYQGVDQECDEYQAMAGDLTLVDDLRQGTRRMREQHDLYLPAFAEEKSTNYKRRWSQATLLNAFEETVGLLTGKAFARAPSLDEDVPIGIAGDEASNKKGLAENIDRAGNHLLIFAENVFKEGIRSGLTHILVDSTPLPKDAVTEAEKQLAGHRPYWVHIKAQDLFAWTSEIKGGEEVLTQVRIRETVSEKEGEFSSKKVQQIRVLEIGRCRVFRRESENGDWELVEDRKMTGYDGKPLTYIPLVTYYTDEDNGFMTAIPPLLDLAYKNIEHFQVHSDYRNCLTVACFPIFCISGWQSEDNQIILGPTTTIKLTDPGAKAYFAEHTGQALGAARQYLSDLKEEMAMYGLRMLLPKPGQSPTATGEAITEARTSSQLQVAMLRLKDVLELALDYTARWLGLGEDAGGSILVSTQALMLNQTDIDSLLKAAGAPQRAVLPVETVITELIRRGFLDEGTDPKEVMAMLDNQAMQGTALGGLAGSFLRPAAVAPAAPATLPGTLS